MIQKKRTAILCFAVCLVFSTVFTGCGKKEGSSDPENIRKIIEEMVVDYGAYGADAEQKTASLLKELEAADPGLGTRWNMIMKIWTSADLGKPLH